MDKNILYIPVNVRRRKEIVDGIGKEELVKIGILTGIGFVIGIMLFLIYNYNFTFVVITPTTLGAGGVMFLKKDFTNRSTIDKLKDLYIFSKSQKRYDYEYINIYEKIDKR